VGNSSLLLLAGLGVVVSLNFASWNQMAAWLRRIECLQIAA
jgi:hypothetical protein